MNCSSQVWAGWRIYREGVARAIRLFAWRESDTDVAGVGLRHSMSAMRRHKVCASLALTAVLSFSALAFVGVAHAEQPASNEAVMTQANLAEADETWDSEAAILSHRNVSFDELSDDPELQGAALIPRCPAGTVFVESSFRGSSVNVMLRGTCEPDKRLKGEAPAASLLEEEGDDSAEAQTPLSTATTAFDVDAGCVVTLDDSIEPGDDTLQTCADDSSEYADDVVRYSISADADTPLVLNTCLLAHPEEVSGDGAQCGSNDSAGSAAVSADASSTDAADGSPATAGVAAVAVAPAAYLSGAVASWVAAPAEASPAATSEAVAPIAVSGTVYTVFHGVLVSETQVGADGLAEIVIAGLPEGVHDVVLVFEPAQSGLEVTYIELTVNSVPTGFAGEATNSLPLLVGLGIAMVLAVIVVIWLMVGGRIYRAQA